MFEAASSVVIVQPRHTSAGMIKIVENISTKRKKYLSAACGNCDETGHVVYQSSPKGFSQWACRSCRIEFTKTEPLLTSAVYLEADGRYVVGQWVAEWLDLDDKEVSVSWDTDYDL